MTIQIDKGQSLGMLNITPLIDVVFLLLIFFLVATRFEEVERQLPIVLPEASEAKPLIVQPKELCVNVASDGKFYIGGELVDARGLEQALRQAYANNQGRQQVIIRADKRATVEAATTVMNLCNKTHMRNYTLATE
jgi:biopolymer transport protein ExbD